MKNFLITLVMLLSSLNGFAQNETIDNQTVLDLLKEGFTSELIISTIETASTRTISWSIDYMRQLKEAGADNDLIMYIQKIGKTDYGYEGVYWWNAGEKPMKLHRVAFEKEKKGFNLGTIGAIAGTAYGVGNIVGGRRVSGGEAAAVTAGVGVMMSSGKDIQKLAIMGKNAKMVMSGENGRRPVFRFYLPKKDINSFAKESDNYWFYSVMNEIESPNEFQVVKMKQKKNRRIFPEKMSYTVAGFSGSNASTREIIDFQVNDINNNTFEVTFNQDLEPGEYVFFWKNGLSNEMFKQHVFGFDFTVAE